MITNVGRAIVRRLVSRGPNSSTDRVAQLSYEPLRVLSTLRTKSTFAGGQGWVSNGVFISKARRFLATKPASRPKGHTGRTTSKPRKKAPTTTTSAASKKSPAAKGKATTKAKPRATTKAKPRAKPKAKPRATPKVRAKKALTPEQKTKAAAQKDRARIRELRKTALEPPKLLPASAYKVVLTELSKPGQGIKGKEAAEKYKALTPTELEHYNHIASQNAAANDASYKKWVLSHTPDQIRAANNARAALKHASKKKTLPIHDGRLVKRPRTAWILFYSDRVGSADFKHIKVTDRVRLISQEWKDLPASEKKKYTDMQAQDQARYKQEYKTVYGHEPGRTLKRRVAV
ncbi:hypothetical protein MMC16_003172 [Acarospora aff. strigata]|nr:hypothetical protein [Acarospora aff. strigata]